MLRPLLPGWADKRCHPSHRSSTFHQANPANSTVVAHHSVKMMFFSPWKWCVFYHPSGKLMELFPTKTHVPCGSWPGCHSFHHLAGGPKLSAEMGSSSRNIGEIMGNTWKYDEIWWNMGNWTALSHLWRYTIEPYPFAANEKECCLKALRGRMNDPRRQNEHIACNNSRTWRSGSRFKPSLPHLEWYADIF